VRWRTLLAAGPVVFATYALGWLLVEATTGLLQQAGFVLFALAYVGVFWGGWLAIPILGVGATFGQPMLDEPWRSRTRHWFIVWLLAWIGVLPAVVWLGPPAGFEPVPT
jgi:hypothetical protein